MMSPVITNLVKGGVSCRCFDLSPRTAVFQSSNNTSPQSAAPISSVFTVFVLCKQGCLKYIIHTQPFFWSPTSTVLLKSCKELRGVAHVIKNHFKTTSSIYLNFDLTNVKWCHFSFGCFNIVLSHVIYTQMQFVQLFEQFALNIPLKYILWPLLLCAYCDLREKEDI